MANKTSTFQDNNPPKADALWFNMVTTEIKNLVPIDGSTVDPNGTINDQAVNSIKSYVSQAGILCTDTGTANNYVLGASSPFANPMLKTGCRVRFKTANPNTGASNIVAFGGTSIACRKSDGITPLSANDIPSNIEVEFVYNGTYWVQVFSGNKATTTTQGVAYLNTPISVANSVSSPNDTIDFGAGTYITLSGQQIYLPAITKKIQSTGSWTAGSGNNGLDTGVRTANTFYRTYVVQNNSTLAYDIVFSASYLSPTIPSGYTNLGIIDYAFIRVNGSNNIASAKWDVNDKRLVLGSGQAIQIFSGVATGSGNTTVMNTTEKLEFSIRLSLSTSSAGGSDISVYGSEHDGSDGYDVAQATTNNGFSTSIGPVPIYTSDGKIYWKNFSTSGGVSNQTCKIKSIKIRS